MKNYGELGEGYPPRPTASTDNTLLDLLKGLVRGGGGGDGGWKF